MGAAVFAFAGVLGLPAGLAAAPFFGVDRALGLPGAAAVDLDADGRGFAAGLAAFVGVFAEVRAAVGLLPGAVLGPAVREAVFVPALRVLIPGNMRRAGCGGLKAPHTGQTV